MKVYFYKFTIFFLLLTGMIACIKEKERCEPFSLIAQGTQGSGTLINRNLVIKEQEEWGNLINNLSENVKNSFHETEIDFDNYQIIAVFDNVRNFGYWKIEVMCITECSDKITVNVKAYSSGGAASPQIISYPYHIIKIPASTKRIEFKHG